MNPRVLGAAAALLLSCGVVALIATDRPETASAAVGDAINHPSVVPDSPEREYPVIMTSEFDARNRRGQSYAMNLVGNYVISGGNFQNIRLQDGSVIDQPYLSVVDWRTKAQECTNLDVNDEVLAIEEGPRDNTAYIAGRFNKATGADGVERTRNKIALVDLTNCAVDRTFSSIGANGKITDIAFTGDRLFVGGDFTSIGGVGQVYVAELDPTTGAVRTNFDVTFTSGGLSSPIRMVDVNPAETRLVVSGRFGSVSDSFGNQVSSTVTTVIDISGTNPVVTPHSFDYPHPEFGERLYGTSLQDAALSPDGNSIGLAFGTATISDFVYLVPAVEAPTSETWQFYTRDSNFSVDISNNAMYVAGHFCKVDNGPGGAALMAPNSGPSTCTGSNQADGVWRTQIAALSLSDGTPLEWNPGNDAFRGGNALKVVPRGLLVGFDGTRSDSIETGTTAFFDFGPPPDPRDGQACDAVVNDDQTVTISWDDVPQINNWSVRRNTQFVAQVSDANSYTDEAPKGTHTYYLRSTFNGDLIDLTCGESVTTEGPAAQTCTATLNPEDGSVLIEWTANPGATNYNVRRNTKWLAGTDAFSYTDVPQSGTHLYIIRSSVDGTRTNTDCAPEITTEGPPAQTCTATDAGNGSVLIEFTPVFGEDTYTIRRDGTFAAETTALSYTEVPGEGSYSYSVRSRLKGRTTETSCGEAITIGNPPPPPEAIQTCVATTNADGSITLSWSAIAGENRYGISRNGAFADEVVGALTWSSADAVPGDVWTIRSRQGVVRTDSPCVDAPAAGCTIVVDDDRAHVAWADFNNEDRSYVVRRNGSDAGTVTTNSALAFSGNHNAGDTWEIYSQVKGSKVTITCEP